jgi:hypothetical protein
MTRFRIRNQEKEETEEPIVEFWLEWDNVFGVLYLRARNPGKYPYCLLSIDQDTGDMERYWGIYNLDGIKTDNNGQICLRGGC